MRPRTKYVKSGDVHIAYQVIGTGPLDLVAVSGWVSHVENAWEEPEIAAFLERLASFSRLIVFDKRGTGLSDKVSNDAVPTLEQRMDDVRAVMEAAGSMRAALLGISEGGSMSALFASTYPERTSALIFYGSFPNWIRDAECPWGQTREEHEAACRAYEEHWGSPIGLKVFAPSIAKDEGWRERWGRYLRLAASPGAAAALYRMNIEIDIRKILPTIQVPTLILHRTGDRIADVRGARYMAERIPGAKYVELPGDDHLFWIGDSNFVTAEIQEFLTGIRPQQELDRILATVLSIDLVGSTEKATALGDGRWKDLLGRYHARAQKEVERHRGRVVDFAGDGVLAVFDGPARAIRCSCTMREAVKEHGLELRAGVHTGECETSGDKISGIAVHICCRIASLAASGEILVSSTVKDLVAGSGLKFLDRGTSNLKGIPDPWRLFAVAS
jgi:class 3 adenylate cyclase/pimeloyl-ACP methyl ester carboxylesterase